MPRSTALDRVEIAADGSVAVRLLKLVIDGGELVASEPHRHVIPANGDISDNLARVNEHLNHLGWPTMRDEDVAIIGAHASIRRA